MEDRTKRLGGLVAGVGVGAAAAAALRRRWSGGDEPEMPPPEFDAAGASFLDHLAEAVRIPTVSYEDRSRIDLQAFDRLHAFLASTYPLVHERLQREVVGGHSLLFTWPGSNLDAPAVVLMAHQDVVPIEDGTEGDWEFPPFDGARDATYLWGRGALDDKGALIGILEAVEGLLRSGFEPRATLYLVFGHDEEIGGGEGAAVVAQLLRDREIQVGIVLDEGGAVAEDMPAGAKAPIGLLGIGEKGHVNVELVARGDGGHSSMPPQSTAVGRVAEAVRRLEASPMAPRLEVQHGFLKALAEVMPQPRRSLLANPGMFGAVLERVLGSETATNALIRTTMAATFIEGGGKPNALPQSARAIVNVRILPGDDVESVLAHVRRVVGDEIAVAPGGGGFVSDPPPLSNQDGPGYRLLRDLIGETFGVGVAPWILTGATDSRYFIEVAGGSVYRFAPFVVGSEDMGRVHGTGERVRLSDASRAVGFYAEFVRRAAG